jgi:signal peptidase I
MVITALVVLAGVATYIGNPLRVANLDPVARISGFSLFRQASESMLPTIPKGKPLIVSSWSYIESQPQFGDVVVFQYPPDRTILYAKRIIATGGQNFEIKNCVIFLDGRAIQEPYVDPARARKSDSCEMAKLLVPQGKYLLLGDNRDNSMDSRYWGFVPRDHIVGKVML